MSGERAAERPSPPEPRAQDWIIALVAQMAITHTESAWVAGRPMTYQEIHDLAQMNPAGAVRPGAADPPDLMPFTYLLNAFEHASQSEKPAEMGYAAKRRAVFDYVRAALSGGAPK